MYIIKAEHMGLAIYWTGSRFGWSTFKERAYHYKTARGACSALMRHKAKQHPIVVVNKVWARAEVVVSVGWG